MRRTVISTVLIAGLLASIAAAPAMAAPGGSSDDPGAKGKAVGQQGSNGNAGGNGNSNGNGNAGSGGNALGAAPAPMVATPETEPAYALPSWGDGQWGSSENYETIQSGDLDGDGDAELIGRSVRGIEAWDFDQTAGQWAPIVTSNEIGWSDDAGWNQKQYYETIGTADLDGDGRDEIYSRNAEGLTAVRLVPPANSLENASWQDLPQLHEYAASAGWDIPQYYATLQAADLDGDGRDEVFGRAAAAVIISSFDGTGWSVTSFPEFTDAGGWDKPGYYDTIQAADLDGDGSAEIFGRGSDGVQVWALEAGGWTELAASGPFTDSEHWSQAEFASTIATADLDGDGDHEVIGRGTSGLYAFEFADATGKKNAGTWTELPKLTAFSNGNGWGGANRYATIQGADIDGDGRDEIIARDNLTMVAWGFTASSKTWANEQHVDGPGFTDTLGWDLPRYYETIQAVDVDGVTANGQPGSANAARADLIGRGPNGIQTYRFDAKAGSWTSPSATFPTFTGAALTAYEIISHGIDVTTDDIRSKYDSSVTDLGNWIAAVPKVTQPDGMPDATWNQVQTQIITELTWAKAAATSAHNLTDLIDAVKGMKDSDTTATHLDYVTTQANTSSIIANLLVMLAGFADAASNLGDPGLQFALGALDAVASFAASEGQNANASFEGTYLDLEGAIGSWWGTAETANENAKTAIVSDYGLLSTVGTLYGNGTWTQFAEGGPGWAAAVNAHAKAYSIWIWQALTPTLPNPCGFLEICTGWVIAECESDYCPYTHDGNDYSLWVTACDSAQQCDYVDDGFVLQIQVAPKVPESLLKQLFEDTTPGCESGWDSTTCNLGVEPYEVMAGLDGWNYQCSLWRSTFWTNGWNHESFCTNLEAVRDRYGTW